MTSPTARDFLFEHETEHNLAYYSAIGRIVVLWSMLEAQWDVNQMMLFHRIGGNQLVREPPIAMKRKIDFWNRCFRTIESLAPKREKGLEFGTLIGESSDDRNTLLHTNWGNVLQTDGAEPIIYGSSLRSNSGGYTHSTSELSIKQLSALTEKTGELQMRLLEFTFFLTQLQSPTPYDRSQRLP